MPVRQGRDGIDDEAKQIVLEAYREACANRAEQPFEAALGRYVAKYPYVRKELAGHAVAHILSSAGI
jgi:hypothetical protein